jgi:hypothetical protein
MSGGAINHRRSLRQPRQWIGPRGGVCLLFGSLSEFLQALDDGHFMAVNICSLDLAAFDEVVIFPSSRSPATSGLSRLTLAGALVRQRSFSPSPNGCV